VSKLLKRNYLIEIIIGIMPICTIVELIIAINIIANNRMKL